MSEEVCYFVFIIGKFSHPAISCYLDFPFNPLLYLPWPPSAPSQFINFLPGTLSTSIFIYTFSLLSPFLVPGLRNPYWTDVMVFSHRQLYIWHCIIQAAVICASSLHNSSALAPISQSFAEGRYLYNLRFLACFDVNTCWPLHLFLPVSLSPLSYCGPAPEHWMNS